MKKLLLGAVAALGIATSANAAQVVSFEELGVGAGPGETMLFDFESANPAVTGTGNWGYYTGLTPGVAAPPVGNATQYLAIQNGGEVTIDFGGLLTQFSLDIGSVDDFNVLTLVFADNSTQSFVGAALTGLGLDDGSQSDPRTNGRLTIAAEGSEQIKALRLSSTGNSFEVDNLATTPISPIPEPATWAMMITGFGLVGASLRRRKSVAVNA